MGYITSKQLQDFGEATDADNVEIFKNLAESASAIFDLACEVESGFFNKAKIETKDFFGDGTIFLKITACVKNSITEVKVNNIIVTNYIKKDNYLIFQTEIESDEIVNVTANFGFENVPNDVQQACIELGLLIWRRKDISFAAISDADASAVSKELPPTTVLVVEKYKAKYSQAVIFG